MPKPTTPRPPRDEIQRQDNLRTGEIRDQSWELREKLIMLGLKLDSDLGMGRERFMAVAREHGLA